jgi:DNA helicase-2/ATP-dependent DNA helicase PcrA
VFEAEWDAGLDDAQLAAVAHTDGPLVILAGAGTGKTRTLTARVARLLAQGADPSRVLLLTFTRRAAADMLARAGALCGHRRAAARLWGGTFHAVAHRLVTEYAETLNLPQQFSVLDQADAADLMDLLRHEYGLGGTGARFPRADTLVDAYSRAVNTGRPARELIAAEFPWCHPHVEQILDLFRGYMVRKRADGLLDFDDLLLAWRSLLRDPVVGPALAARWDHVLVDEYQDVNQVQVNIVRLLCPEGTGLSVVGDDAQAIYGFRGADTAHLTDLASTLPGATIVRLERNFRSRQPLLDLANTVRPTSGQLALRLHSDRSDGPRPRLVRCYDAATEARLVTDAVLESRESGLRLRDQAVLMRAGHHSDLLEIELTARRVPFVKYGGLKFLEAAHVKDFLAGLRLLDNRADEIAWYRLLRLHDGIGPARARILLGVLQPARGADEDHHADVIAAAPANARVKLAATFAGLTTARTKRTTADRAAAVVAMLRPLLIRRYPDHPMRLDDLDRLIGAATAAPSLAEYVATLTLDPPASTGDLAGPPHQDEDYLNLSTVHSAKGLEWDAVHVIGLVDGAFPSDMALGGTDTGLVEEQRLFYVALTRARDQLTLYTPLRMPHQRYTRSDRHSIVPASRFLTEQAMATLEVIEAAPPAPPARRTLTLARVTVPTLDDLWA